MKDFKGKLAVITGGGTGMGRELARQLAAKGCSVAMCDVSAEAMAETKRLCSEDLPDGTRVSTHQADVSVEEQMMSFQRGVASEHGRESINFLFNNAGIAGGGSFVAGSREEWERTFGACWFGVYYGCRIFLPMLIAADEGHIVNTSSVNGFWAALGPGVPHSAYSTAKFAVKGFTEALIEDLRLNAPHVKCSVVMPGHIGTDIVANTMSQQGVEGTLGRSDGSDEELKASLDAVAQAFKDDAPMTAAEAATVILEGVAAEKWRILVGDDAHALDRRVRESPEKAYDPDFFELFSNSVLNQ